jgi:predicted phosphodiesterase
MDGPRPKKTLQRLEEVGAQCVRGNTDRYIAGIGEEQFATTEAAQLAWTRKQLGEKWLTWMRELPFALRVGDEDNQLLIVHANPANDEDQLWPDADDATLTRLIGEERARTIAFGHVHLPYVRQWRDRMLVNVASAGLPKDGDPRAGYAIFTAREGGWEVKHRRVVFDVKKVATQLADCGIPESAELIATLRRHRYKRLKGYIP